MGYLLSRDRQGSQASACRSAGFSIPPRTIRLAAGLAVVLVAGRALPVRAAPWGDVETESASASASASASESVTAATESRESWIEQVVQRSADSVVLITVEGRDGRQAGLGSGFVVSADGLIATNLHVIGEARPINVRFRNGQEANVTQIFASDRQLDLALIRVAAEGLTPLPLASNEGEVTQGQPIIALGNPMGLRNSVVRGVVSGTREIDGREMIQIAMPIEPGNSGGPLLDADGQVLGIVTLKSAVTANLGFAIQVSALRTVMASPNPIAISRWRTMGLLNEDDWSPIFGARWQQRSGQIWVSETGDSFGGRALCLWNGALPQLPLEFGAFVRLDDEAGAAGLVFDADGGDRHYGFYPSAGRMRLTRFDGPTVYSWKILEEFRSPHYQAGKWNHLKVRVDGEQVTCFVNDQPVLKRTLPGLGTGRIGLAKFRDTHARFRQFHVAPQLAPTQPSEERLMPARQRLATTPLQDANSADLLATLADDPDASVRAIEDRAEELGQQLAQLKRLANDVHVRDTCRKLAALFDDSPPTGKLAEAALLVSRLDNPELDVAAYQNQVNRMADEIRAALPDAASATDRVAALNRYLFEENGFHGSRTNYYHAANSYFDRVLDDREGLPITLAILYLELAQRLQLTMEGVGLPGHFVVRFSPPNDEVQLIDVFDGGKPLSLDEARRISLQSTGTPLDDSFLEAVDNRAITLRVLRNLQGLAQRNEDSEALLRYLEAMVSLAPDEPSYRGMRAVVRHQTGRRQAAVDDLDWFLENSPAGTDMQAIRNLKQRFAEDN